MKSLVTLDYDAICSCGSSGFGGDGNGGAHIGGGLKYLTEDEKEEARKRKLKPKKYFHQFLNEESWSVKRSAMEIKKPPNLDETEKDCDKEGDASEAKKKIEDSTEVRIDDSAESKKKLEEIDEILKVGDPTDLFKHKISLSFFRGGNDEDDDMKLYFVYCKVEKELRIYWS